MASIFKVGVGYAARVRLNGKSAYKAGVMTNAAAQVCVRETETAPLGMRHHGREAGDAHSRGTSGAAPPPEVRPDLVD